MKNIEKNLSCTKPLSIVHSLGGCGGTLLAQCLGSMQNVFVLSECNPLSSTLFEYQLNPLTQIKKWLPEFYLLIEDQFTVNDLQNEKRFQDFIIAMDAYLLKNNRRLVLRDYSYIDYLGVPFLDKPARRSSLPLPHDPLFHSRRVNLIRHPLLQYNSLRSHDVLKNKLHPDIFLQGYKVFLADFRDAKVVKYEDIVSDPVTTLAQLCNYLELPFSNEFMNTFYHNRTITGNFNRINEKTISFSKQEILDDHWTIELQNHDDFKWLVTELGYE